MTISEAGYAVQIARPDFKRMTSGDKKVFGQVWRETLRKTKYLSEDICHPIPSSRSCFWVYL